MAPKPGRPADGCMGVRTGGPASVAAMSKVPTAAYSIGLKIVLDNVPGTLGRLPSPSAKRAATSPARPA